MSVWRIIPEFPLLRRELTELAQRKRTYVVRVLGAAFLLATAMIVYSGTYYSLSALQRNIGGSRGAISTAAFLTRFGLGGIVFERMVPYLFWTVDLLMPALCCAAITSEKERNTLGTLFLTRLSPLTLLLEKLFSRLVPMFTLLLLTLPILAFVYSLGGVDTTVLISTLWLLFWECVLLASIGMVCSCWFPTTVSAFVWSYAIVGLLLVLTQSTGLWLATPRDVWDATLNRNEIMQMRTGFGPPATAAVVTLYGVDVRALLRVISGTIPAIAMSAVLLMTGRFMLVRRAFVSSSSLLLRAFKALDAFFVSLNERTTRGVMILADHNAMPVDDPVAWRERTRKSFGKARYLFRILVATEGPTLFICVLAAEATTSTAFDGLRILYGILWATTGVILCVKAGTLISSEFARETIAPLLSTPMTAAEILRQKVVGMRRLMLVLSMPLFSVNLTLLLLHYDLSGGLSRGGFTVLARALTYLALVVASVSIVMLELTWLSTLTGLRFQKQTRSILASIASCGLFVAAPVVVARMLRILQVRFGLVSWDTTFRIVDGLSPAGLIVTIDKWLIGNAPRAANWMRPGLPGDSSTSDELLLMAVGMILFHAVVLLLVRQTTLMLAPRLLHRREQTAMAPLVRPLASTRQLATG